MRHHAIKVLLVVGLCCANALLALADDSDTITVKLARKSNPLAESIPMTLVVNGNILGSIANGKDISLKFSPNMSSKYSFYLEVGAARSKVIDVTARPGSTIVVVGNMDKMWNGPLISARVLGEPRKNITVKSVKLAEAYVEKELAREIVETPRGAKRTIKRSRTFEREINFAKSNEVEVLANVDLVILSSQVRGRIEQTHGQTFKRSETIEQTIEIDGNVLPRVALVWVEKRRVGTASAIIDGVNANLPFELGESLELRIVSTQR